MDRDLAALTSIGVTGQSTSLYAAWISTLFGFDAWGYLLRQYDAAVVAPYSLLVPVFGISSAAVVLHERMNLLEIGASALTTIGVAVTTLRRRSSPTPTEPRP